MTTLADICNGKLIEVNSGCWEFSGGRVGGGYGFMRGRNGKWKGAHIVAYEETKGLIPTGMYVCHTCDNPPCCNPDHLFLGTALDNKKDEIQKDRHVYGERVGNSKLTENDVLYIRRMLSEGQSLTFIAWKFNVTHTAILYIKTGKNWGWLK